MSVTTPPKSVEVAISFSVRIFFPSPRLSTREDALQGTQSQGPICTHLEKPSVEGGESRPPRGLHSPQGWGVMRSKACIPARGEGVRNSAMRTGMRSLTQQTGQDSLLQKQVITPISPVDSPLAGMCHTQTPLSPQKRASLPQGSAGPLSEGQVPGRVLAFMVIISATQKAGAARTMTCPRLLCAEVAECATKGH